MRAPGNGAPAAAAPPVPPIYTDEQIKAMAELAGRHTIERTTLACEQQNARIEQAKRHEAERLQLGNTLLEEAGTTGLEAGAAAAAPLGGARAHGR